MRKRRARLETIDPIFLQASQPATSYTKITLGADDVHAMSALQTRCGPDNVVPRDMGYYESHFAAGHSAIGIVDGNGTLIAHALIRSDNKNTSMLNVLVDPQHRGQQLQKQMVELWLADATRQGIQTASARVRLSAGASFKNFANAGLNVVAEEPSPEAPHHMTYLMQKSLQPTLAYRPSENRPSAPS